MRKIAAAICGGAFFLGGINILTLVFAGLDWQRVDAYGLFHELIVVGGLMGQGMYLIGFASVMLGVIILISTLFLCIFSKRDKVEIDTSIGQLFD